MNLFQSDPFVLETDYPPVPTPTRFLIFDPFEFLPPIKQLRYDELDVDFDTEKVRQLNQIIVAANPALLSCAFNRKDFSYKRIWNHRKYDLGNFLLGEMWGGLPVMQDLSLCSAIDAFTANYKPKGVAIITNQITDCNIPLFNFDVDHGLFGGQITNIIKTLNK